MNILPTKKRYNIVYADPPWRYSGQGSSAWMGRGAKKHYPTMDLEEIKSLKIPSSDDSVLFLWVVFPLLKEGLEVLDAWGFKYKTVAFVWIKLNKKNKEPFCGMGAWTRSNSEICLLGTKGKIARISARVRQVIISERREHSRKPDEVRDRIVELMGNRSRIELFARQKNEGWDVWGNEVDKFNKN